MKLRTHWEHFDNNPTRAVLCLDVRLPNYPSECTCPACVLKRALVIRLGPPSAEPEPEEHQCTLPDRDQELVSTLLQVHGVSDLRMNGYRLGVERGDIFEWDEIKPRVEAIVAEWAGMDLARPYRPPHMLGRLWRRLSRRT